MQRIGQKRPIRSNAIQLKLTKLLPATPEEIFDMWLNPDSFRRWMRPSDAEVVYLEMHPVVGGSFRFDLQEKDGRIFVHRGEYLVIQRPQKLQFTWDSTVLGRHTSLVTIEFHEQEDQCLLILQHDLPDDEALFQDHSSGWTLILDRLANARKAIS